MTYTTKIMEFIHTELNNDVSVLKETPFYENNPKIRKAGLIFELQQHEIDFYIKLSTSIELFSEKLSRSTEEGIRRIELFKFQKEYLKNISDNKFNINLSSRQMGVNLILAIHILHTAIFNNDKTILICTNLRDTSIEIMNIIKSIYYNLPFYLKPGVVTWNQTSINFENGCKIRTSARPKTAGFGYTIDSLYMIDFAHIPSHIIEAYYTGMFPVMSAYNNSKIVISSSPNGENLFHKIYLGSVEGKNNFKNTKMHYSLIPNRDEKWVKDRIEEIGDMAFEQEYNLSFAPVVKLTENNTINELFPSNEKKIEKKDFENLVKRIETLEFAINQLVIGNNLPNTLPLNCINDTFTKGKSAKIANQTIGLDLTKEKGDASKITTNPGQVTQADVNAYFKSKKDNSDFIKFKSEIINPEQDLDNLGTDDISIEEERARLLKKYSSINSYEASKEQWDMIHKLK